MIISQNSLTFWCNTRLPLPRIISSRHDERVLPTKASTYAEPIALHFLKNQGGKSSTRKGFKLLSRVSSYQNQQLIASNLRNQSATDRMTFITLAHMC